MKRLIYIATVGFTVLTVLFSVLYLKFNTDLFITLSITFGTILYHFLMRLAVGFLVPHSFHYTDKFFTEKAFEKPLYKSLKVKKWKRFMPSYNPDSYSIKNDVRSLETIADTTCRNEIIHLVICLLSFVPVSFTAFFGAAAVFIITSVLSCMLDMIFVIMQRYNRPRLVKIINRKNKLS
ncbi:MAG: hypothetical protein ACI4IE_08130 [Eubacterium sp.]